MVHPVKWLSPSPIWTHLIQNEGPAFSRPEILQFASDNFMEELLEALRDTPAVLNNYRARPETWRGPRTGLKLYQPAHQRHYLVAASLVCDTPGLPDRQINLSSRETVSFVIRRLYANDAGQPEEHALVSNEDGYAWEKVISGERPGERMLVPGEEILPMFRLNYTKQNLQKRQLFAGTIPVSKAEIYENSVRKPSPGTSPPAGAAPLMTPREFALQNDVIAPWNNLIDLAVTARQLTGTTSHYTAIFGNDAPSDGDISDKYKKVREQIQTASWYILLDFARYLETYINPVWLAVRDNNPAGLQGGQRDLYDELGNIRLVVLTGLPVSIPEDRTYLRAVLRLLINDPAAQEFLESTDSTYNSSLGGGWPDFLFPFADPEVGTVGNTLRIGSRTGPVYSPAMLSTSVQRALPESFSGPAPEVPLAAKLAHSGRGDADGGTYLIRCIYQRPNCFPYQRDLLSEATRTFQMAGFYDPEAPARPIRITLPADPTPAGLRKYAKNTAFMMSDALCGKVNALKKVSFGDLVLSVLPWPFHKDLDVGAAEPCNDGSVTFGKVCSLSIPIVTICAMILMIMIVYILDFVFKWVPWLITCFPLPGFKKE